jgi:hypothetical protein
METTSNISPWLHSIQHTFSTLTHESFTTIGDHGVRIRNTREKINYLLHKIHMLELELTVPIGSYHERIGDMIAIRNAIGTYGIYHPTHKRRMDSNMVWHRYGLTLKSSGLCKEGKEWLDYFGEDDGITDVGGYITVSLSHSGIEYLNGIWEGVSSLSSSYDDTTVVTI